MSDKKRLFISSVQKEFAAERRALKDFIHGDPLFLARYIEKAGTGTLDMIALCKEAGLSPPEFRQDGGLFIQTLWRPAAAAAQPPAEELGTKWAPSGHQVAILEKCRIETALTDLMTIAGRADRTKFRHQVLNPLLEAGLIEMTIPDKPRSSQQKYRRTGKGKSWLKASAAENDA